MRTRKAIGCVLAVPLTCVVCVGLLWVYNFMMVRFGRMTDFASLTVPGDTPIQGTEYSLNVTLDDFRISQMVLVNNTNNHRQQISAGIAHEAYTTFRHRGRQYLIVRSYGGGTNYALDYVVVDISGDTPRTVGSGQACSNPKLEDDHLEFYNIPGKCDFFPFAGGISAWVMELDSD